MIASCHWVELEQQWFLLIQEEAIGFYVSEWPARFAILLNWPMK
jgi:hypothetical protein